MNNSHIKSVPAMPSDPAAGFVAEPACPTWKVSIELSTPESLSLVLVVRIDGESLTLGVCWLISTELVEAIRSIVGKIVIDEKLEKLTREEVDAGIVLVAVVTILDDVDVWITFGLCFCQSLRNSEKLALIHIKDWTSMIVRMCRCDWQGKQRK